MEAKHKAVALFILVLIFGYLSFRVLQPFLNFVLMGLVLAFLLYPVYRKLSAETNHGWAAFIILLLVLLLIVLPSLWLTTSLIGQANNAYQIAQSTGLANSTTLAKVVQSWVGFDLQEVIGTSLQEGKTALAAAIPHIISGFGETLIGLVMMFFVLYYALKDGPHWYAKAGNLIPLRHSYKKKLRDELELMTKALFFGQVLTAIMIGVVTGGIFALFGISNALFWGFVMMIFSFLPFLGAPIIYIPAGIILIINHSWFSGIAVIVLCTAAVLVVDTILRPKFVGKAAKIHPLTVILGALGGIALMGFIGFVIGPLILNLFMTLLSFDYGEESK